MKPTPPLLKEIGILPMIEPVAPDVARSLGAALVAGDLPAVLIPFSPAAIETVRAITREGLIAGVGEIGSAGQAKLACEAGAHYVLTSDFNTDIIDFCLDKGVMAIASVTSESQLEAAAEKGLRVVRFFSTAPRDRLAQLKIFAERYPSLEYIVTDAIDRDNLRDYLAFGKICALAVGWIATPALTAAGKFDEITGLAQEAVWAMHSFSLFHVGINCADADASAALAQKMAFLFGFGIRERPYSYFSGTGFELMKGPDQGEKGHIALGTHDAVRAAAFLKRKGIATIPGTERFNDDGTLRRVYLDLDLAGFAVHLRRY